MAERLLVHQALWGMQQLNTPEMPVAAQFDRIAAAGFDGVGLDLGALSMAEARAARPHFERTGLACGLTAFPASNDELKAALELAHELNAPFLTVIGQHMPLELAEMAAVVRAWLRLAEQARMPLHFETHRNCITNDLFTTLQLLEVVPQMRLAADLSHYVVAREMPTPLTATLRSQISAVLARADSLQGRVAGRSQIQLPLHFAQHAHWVAQFRAWWREGFDLWLARPQRSSALVFLCELGPPDYAMTDAQGAELSDRWVEALQLAQWAREIFAQALENFRCRSSDSSR